MVATADAVATSQRSQNMKKVTIISLLIATGLLNAKIPLEFTEIEYVAKHLDRIKIEEVNLIETDELKIGSVIEVIGSYELGSTQNALLGLSITSTEKNGQHYPKKEEQKKIEKGSGDFRLLRKIDRNGGIHLSIYPLAESGNYEQSTSRLYFLELKNDSNQSE
ncbi:hypothetical protein [Rubellicoccus peritrichatus]|uniref:Uncharacterized protein n=1 Tax=Rubellicoccus peritrichatus TaxID=3080537 RepID=A0AAQ3QUW3_9BACT|nr:hypothetical protein [Puniceicoccus sp. CR14]WOO40350.1 hypothetical protein RZN69_17160 [Puniceicoccus sp. CR14]